MDELMLVGVLMVLLVIGGFLMGWLSMLRIKALEQRLRDMEARLAHGQADRGATVMHTPASRAGVDKSPDEASSVDGLASSMPQPPLGDSPISSSGSTRALFRRLLERLLHGSTSSLAGNKAESAGLKGEIPQASAGVMSRLLILLQEHWMILVGALSLVMAGILLVGYSLEQGLLGPGVRLALGIGFGLGMMVLAEWLRLRTTQSATLTGAVSGAGSLVFAASLLAGHFLLALISLSVAFVLLAALSLWMLERARHHGPWLAALGMLGGYALPLALPIHLQWQPASVLLLLGYAGVIAAACRLLYQQVAVSWLYWGGLSGALGWWLLLMPSGVPSDTTLLSELLPWLGSGWIAALALGYLAARDSPTGAAEVESEAAQAAVSTWVPWHASLALRRHWLATGLLSISIALGLWLPWLGDFVSDAPGSLGADANFPRASVAQWQRGWLASLLPLLVIAWSCRRHAVLWSVVALGNGLWLLVWGLALPEYLSGSAQFSPLILSAGLLWLARWRPSRGTDEEEERSLAACWWALATMLPLLAWALCLWQDAMPWVVGASGVGRVIDMGLPPLLWGLACWAGAMRFQAREGTRLAAGLWLSAQLGIFLALVAALEGPSLTLALALQLLGLTACEWRWTREHHTAGRSIFAELTRLLAWGLALRLTWGVVTGTYDDIRHWPLQIFLPVLACVALSSYGMRHRMHVQRWLEGVVIQLALATTVLEIRYLLTDGQPFAGPLSLPELSLQVLALGGVAAGYAWRASGSSGNTALYRALASVVGGLTAAIWLAGVVLAYNPLWQGADVGRWPLVNWLLPAYGLPTLGAALVWRLARPGTRLRHLCEVAGLLALGLWVGISLRHVWHGHALEFWHGVEQAELYAYSIALLIVSAGLVICGARMGQTHWQRVGQGLLVVTVLKVGVWDTATLEGLWRVGSWLGLGSVLMLLSALFNRLAGAGRRAEEGN